MFEYEQLGDQYGDHVELPDALHSFSAINKAWITFIFTGVLCYCVCLRMALEFCQLTA